MSRDIFFFIGRVGRVGRLVFISAGITGLDKGFYLVGFFGFVFYIMSLSG